MKTTLSILFILLFPGSAYAQENWEARRTCTGVGSSLANAQNKAARACLYWTRSHSDRCNDEGGEMKIRNKNHRSEFFQPDNGRPYYRHSYVKVALCKKDSF